MSQGMLFQESRQGLGFKAPSAGRDWFALSLTRQRSGDLHSHGGHSVSSCLRSQAAPVVMTSCCCETVIIPGRMKTQRFLLWAVGSGVIFVDTGCYFI